MATPVIQPSFSAGEVTPSLYGRVDLAKYHVGVSVARNFIVDYRGGLSSRPGTQIVGVCPQTEAAPRLIPFQFNSDQTYVLELSDTLRIITDGGYVLEDNIAITGTPSANPIRFATTADYNVGDAFVVSQITGLLRPNGVSGVNGRTFIVGAIGGGAITLYDPVTGTTVDASTWSGYGAGGAVARVFTVAIPWAVTDLQNLKYAQSADVLTICHPAYPPYNINRLGTINWTITSLAVGTSLTPPPGLASTPIQGTPPSGEVLPSEVFAYQYAVTTYDTGSGEESNVNLVTTCTNLALDQSIGTVNQITWDAYALATDSTIYRVYKAQVAPSGAEGPGPYFFGFMGQTAALQYVDLNYSPDYTTVPPTNQNPFSGGVNNPGCVTYFDQRRVFAASLESPDTFWMTRPGLYSNYDTSYPSNAGDAITDTIVGQEVNAIESLTPMSSGLIVLTSSGAYQISGGAVGAAITPATIQAQPQAFSGASALPPLRVEYDLLYTQARGSAVRDLTYNFYVNVYTGNDVSALSSHLFEQRQIIQWAYAQEPFKVVWCVRDDGALLSFTYLKEQDLYGWGRHDTCGQFKSVTVIAENGEDAVYVVTQRYISGRFVFMTERMALRYFNGNTALNIPPDPSQAWCVDAGLAYPLTYPAANLFGTAQEGSSLWDIKASEAVFTAQSMNMVMRVAGGIGVVSAVISVTEVTVDMSEQPAGVIYNASTVVLPPTPASTWSLTAPVTTVGGLDHLTGNLVSILADGSVVAPQVVVDGCITLPQAATAIVVGLGYTCQMKTLRLDLGEPTSQGKRKLISSVTVRVRDTRGLFIGPDFTDLFEYKDRDVDDLMGNPIAFTTGGGYLQDAENGLVSMNPFSYEDQRINISNDWTREGVVCIQQSYPLPATILAVIPEVTVGDTPQ